MKKPAMNISKSLRGQRAPGRASEPVKVGKLTPGGSRIVPGESGVEGPPGAKRERNSVVHYAEPLGRHFGGK